MLRLACTMRNTLQDFSEWNQSVTNVYHETRSITTKKHTNLLLLIRLNSLRGLHYALIESTCTLQLDRDLEHMFYSAYDGSGVYHSPIENESHWPRLANVILQKVRWFND